MAMPEGYQWMRGSSASVRYLINHRRQIVALLMPAKSGAAPFVAEFETNQRQWIQANSIDEAMSRLEDYLKIYG